MTIITQKTAFYVGRIEQLPCHFCFESQGCFVFGNDAQRHANKSAQQMAEHCLTQLVGSIGPCGLLMVSFMLISSSSRETPCQKIINCEQAQTSCCPHVASRRKPGYYSDKCLKYVAFQGLFCIEFSNFYAPK